MSKRLLKLLPLLLAFVLVCSVSAFAALADEESVDETASTEETSVEETSAEESQETSADESVEESADESADESAEDSADESATESAEDSAASTATESDTTSKGDEGSGLSTQTWQLIITLGVIVVIAAVLFILAKTNTKPGQKISKFFKDNKSELKKVVWMPRKDLIKSTGIVLAVLVCACILIGLLDFGFSSLLNLLSSIG